MSDKELVYKKNGLWIIFNSKTNSFSINIKRLASSNFSADDFDRFLLIAGRYASHNREEKTNAKTT